MQRYVTRCALGGAVIASLAMPTAASANEGDDCSALTGDADNGIPKIYIENGDTQEPLIKKIGKALLASGTKLRIIYRNRPTCQIRDTIFKGQRMTNVYDGTGDARKLRDVRYIPDGDFNVNGPSPKCKVADPVTETPELGEPIVLGIGATYISSCAALDKPADVGVFDGPIQAYGFITHQNSSQVAITAEEGYLAYGFPEGTGQAAPWTVQNLRFKRGDTASTTLTIAAALRLKPAEMLTSDPKGITTSDDLMKLVKDSTTPEATLGIIGTELYDQHRGEGTKLLAFKAFGQRLAYFPDKRNDSFDKQNVRDGHYLPWSPTPYMGKTSGDVLADEHAKRIYDIVMGTGSDGPTSILPVVQSGLVPECAMKVTRAGDGADLTLSTDAIPSCGCYFEKNVPQGSTSCAACENDATCNGGKCRLGFCEAK